MSRHLNEVKEIQEKKSDKESQQGFVVKFCLAFSQIAQEPVWSNQSDVLNEAIYYSISEYNQPSSHLAVQSCSHLAPISSFYDQRNQEKQ